MTHGHQSVATRWGRLCSGPRFQSKYLAMTILVATAQYRATYLDLFISLPLQLHFLRSQKKFPRADGIRYLNFQKSRLRLADT